MFADLGTPNPDRWNVYDELRAQLVARGVPRDKIRFIHEARNDKEKGDLFAACRDGRVAVVIGSTERMGVGTNVQARAVALHHLDCPWRPADLQQREGRILRQGNGNAEVRILRYVTEGSFDGYSWQTVTRKAQFIAQVMRGKLDVREIEDIGDSALSYNEVKALATGNPMLLDHAQAQAEVTKLDRLERAHLRNLETLRWTIRNTTDSIGWLTKRVDAVGVALARRVDTSGEAFTMTLDQQTYTKRVDANERLKSLLTHQMADVRIPAGRVTELGALAGFTVAATVFRDPKGNPTVRLELLDAPMAEVTLSPTEVAGGSLVTRLENRLTALEGIRRNDTADIARRQEEITRATEQLDQPFRHADNLQQARTRLDELTRLIEAAATTPPTSPAPAGTPPGAAAATGQRAAAATGTPGGDVDPTEDGTQRPPLLGDQPRSPEQILPLAVVAVREHGWVSRQDADASDGTATATATLVDRALNGTDDADRALRDRLTGLVTDEVIARAAAIRAWATTLTDTQHDAYGTDLSDVARRDTVEPWRLPLLVSAVAGYDRHERAQQQLQATAGSQWQGTLGDQVTVEGTVLAARGYDHAYGTGTVLRLADTDGNVYTWFSSRALEILDDDRVSITGRIKEHSNWQDRRETQLTRCTVTVLAVGSTANVRRVALPALPPSTAGLQPWEHDWLERQLAALADDETVRAAAVDPGAFRATVETALTTLLRRAVAHGAPDLRGSDTLVRLYLYQDDTRGDLLDTACAAVHQTISASADPLPAHPAASVDGPSSPAGPTEPTGPDAAPPEPPAGIALPALQLAGPQPSADDLDWLQAHLGRFVGEVTAAAHANPYDTFRLVFDERFADSLIDANTAGALDTESWLIQGYFGDHPTKTAINDAAARAVYDAVRQASPPPEADRREQPEPEPEQRQVGGRRPAASADDQPPGPPSPGPSSPAADPVAEVGAAAPPRPTTADRADPDRADPDRVGRSGAAERDAGDVPARRDAEQLLTRAAALEHLHAGTDPARPGMVLHRDGQPDQAVDIPTAVDLFGRMIDRVQQAGQVPAHLSWQGVPITVGRADDPAGARLAITVGTDRAQIAIPLQDAWPAAANRAELLRKLTVYLDGAGDRAAGLRQRAASMAPDTALAVPGPPPADPGQPGTGPDAARRSSASRAFPAPPTGGQAGPAVAGAQRGPDPAAGALSRGAAAGGRPR